MKYSHSNKIKLPHSFKKQQKPLYEYELPQDRLKLIADMSALGALNAALEYPATHHMRADIKEQARQIAKEMKICTKAECLTNNFEMLLEIAEMNYTECYLQRNGYYLLNTEEHKKEFNKINEIGQKRFYKGLCNLLYKDLQVQKAKAMFL